MPQRRMSNRKINHTNMWWPDFPEIILSASSLNWNWEGSTISFPVQCIYANEETRGTNMQIIIGTLFTTVWNLIFLLPFPGNFFGLAVPVRQLVALPITIPMNKSFEAGSAIYESVVGRPLKSFAHVFHGRFPSLHPKRTWLYPMTCRTELIV